MLQPIFLITESGEFIVTEKDEFIILDEIFASSIRRRYKLVGRNKNFDVLRRTKQLGYEI